MTDSHADTAAVHTHKSAQAADCALAEPPATRGEVEVASGHKDLLHCGGSVKLSELDFCCMEMSTAPVLDSAECYRMESAPAMTRIRPLTYP